MCDLPWRLLFSSSYSFFWDTNSLQVFEIDDVKAWKSVLISVTSYALGLFMIAKSPWYLLPLAWAWTGTAVTGVSSPPLSLLCAALLVVSNWIFFSSSL